MDQVIKHGRKTQEREIDENDEIDLVQNLLSDAECH